MQDRATELLPPDAPGEDAGDGAYEHVRARVQALISAARDLSDTCADLADALRPLPGHEDLGGPDFGRLRAERTAALLDEAASAARGTLGLLHSAYSALERQLGRPPAGEVTAPAPRSGVSTWPDAFVELPPRTFTAEGEDDTAVACEVGPAVLEAEPGARVWESGERGEEDGPAPTGVEPAEQAASMGGSRPALAAVEPEARSEEADADGGQPPAGTLTAEDEPADADQGWTPAGPDEHTTEQPDDEADQGWTPAGPDEHTTEQPDDEADQGWTPAGPDEQPGAEADRGWAPADRTEPAEAGTEQRWTPTGPAERPEDDADRGWTPTGPAERPEGDADRGWTPAEAAERPGEQVEDGEDRDRPPVGPAEATAEAERPEAGGGWRPGAAAAVEEPGWEPSRADEDERADRGAVTSAALAGWIAVDPDDEDAGGRPILDRKPDLPWRPDSDDHEPESPDDRLDDREPDDRESDDRESDDRGPADHQPALHEPAAHEPADYQPALHEPADYQPTGHQPADHQPADHQLALHEAAGHQPADHEPAAHEPADYQPAGHQPADHEPADHQAAGQQPADYQPDFGLGPDLEDDRPTRAVAAQQAPAPVLTLPVDPHSGDGAGWHGDTVSPEPRSLSLVPPVPELEPDLPAAYPDPAPWRDEATPPMPATDPETWAAAASQATPYLTAGPTTTDPTAGPRSSWQPVPGLSSRPVWAAEVVPGASAAGDGLPVYPLDTVDVPAGDPDVPLGQDTPPTPAGPLDDPGAAVIARQVEAARRHLQAALVVANQPAAAPRLGALLTAVERVLTAVTDLARETRGVLESGLTDRTFPGEARFLCSPPWERTELVGRDSYGDDMASPAGLAKLLRSLGYEATSVTSAGGVAGVQVRSERYAVHVALVEPAGGGRQRWSGALEWTDATGASRTWAETLGPAELEDEELARRVDELLRRCVGATR